MQRLICDRQSDQAIAHSAGIYRHPAEGPHRRNFGADCARPAGTPAVKLGATHPKPAGGLSHSADASAMPEASLNTQGSPAAQVPVRVRRGFFRRELGQQNEYYDAESTAGNWNQGKAECGAIHEAGRLVHVGGPRQRAANSFVDGRYDDRCSPRPTAMKRTSFPSVNSAARQPCLVRWHLGGRLLGAGDNLP